MSGFFSAMFDEMGARRKRMREALGDRAQGVMEFLVLAGLGVGSLGLFVRDWMPAAEPWGFAVPFAFVIGYVLIDARRQQSLRVAAADQTMVGRRYDGFVFLWSFGCALLGAAAFALAWTAAHPDSGPQEDWRPPANTVPTEIGPR